ncbi:MAG TPA: sigma-70 family RNA polymerase sigma factor [Anaerolineae bacterium]|nr:sigma-70 family RNA polymerase sigma factor [Anaerolineae bacterium]
METRHKSNEVLVERLLPHANADPADRATAWEEWYATVGAPSVLAFVRVQNDTSAPDDDILQDAIVTAYEEVERGRYEPRAGIPFTAYVKGIARNKIREARRRTWRFTSIEETPPFLLESSAPHLERAVEQHEQLTLLRAGLAQLPGLRRQVLLGYLDGHSTEEIAATLNMTEEAVRQHKSRALRSLREMVV